MGTEVRCQGGRGRRFGPGSDGDNNKVNSDKKGSANILKKDVSIFHIVFFWCQPDRGP